MDSLSNKVRPSLHFPIERLQLKEKLSLIHI
ncbi:hypothetical protein A5876_002634, partial [Enterococcus sp. 3C8_DIV0646]